MCNLRLSTLIWGICAVASSNFSLAHGGRLDSSGCHNELKTSLYHCHQGALSGLKFENIEQAQRHLASSTTDEYTTYRRQDYFTSWPDKDRDCQSLRHEMLITQSLVAVTFETKDKCIVSTGKWLDPYTGKYIYKAGDLDVDHVIPLSYAHRHGGSEWTSDKKKAFALDESNLLLVEDNANQAKGDKGPSEFTPLGDFQCYYAQIWNLISKKYKVNLSLPDQELLSVFSTQCLSKND